MVDASFRVIVVHGTGGSPEGNWFPWLREELSKRSIECLIPQFPIQEAQSLDSWLSTFKEATGSTRPLDILIGHSIGAAFVMRALERSHQKVHAAILVAGFARPLGLPEFDPLNATFVSSRFDWERIKRGADTISMYSGDNDPYVPLSFAEELAESLDIEPVIIEGGGHLNAGSGYTTFPDILSDIEILIEEFA